MPYWSMENVPWTNMHDLNLDWIINTMKETVEQWIAYRTQMDTDWASMREDWDAYQEELIGNFNDLKQFVLDYFASLDLSDEVAENIQNMVESGDFLTLIQPTIGEETDAWLASHIIQPGTAITLDSSLTLENAAAQAKAAGLNIDYFPTNFVVHQDQIWYVDYECNEYSEEWNFENWGIQYWHRSEAFEAYLNQHA